MIVMSHKRRTKGSPFWRWLFAFAGEIFFGIREIYRDFWRAIRIVEFWWLAECLHILSGFATCLYVFGEILSIYEWFLEFFEVCGAYRIHLAGKPHFICKSALKTTLKSFYLNLCCLYGDQKQHWCQNCNRYVFPYYAINFSSQNHFATIKRLIKNR